ncbi:DUF4157 domain-containing protein [Streptomyces sp. NPDC016845]|uniref:eCIS core domain-containing protein n=1 Tax=Streptomyces sp. NPDC016845 TaxID=3364972 RepID=UPI0037A3126D
MSGNRTYAEGSAAHDAGQRRQAKSRTRRARSRVPEPKEIITAAGHPLDAGVRRELEARLGHDFGQVRVHTDRDSAALAELVGADAVTVGQEIFFAPGMFRPGTEDGRRLLAHELLHTVQSPHQPGALRAGRDLGAVSSPRDAAEREAERGARSDEPHPEVTHDATPGWLRYATVRADRFRTEQLDPATLVDRLTAGILRSLRGDPADAAGRVRLQLSSFADELREAVVDRLERRLPSGDYHRVLALVEESEHGLAATDTGRAPEPVAGPADAMEEPGRLPEPERLPAGGEKGEPGKGEDGKEEPGKGDGQKEDGKKEPGKEDGKEEPGKEEPGEEKPGKEKPEEEKPGEEKGADEREKPGRDARKGRQGKAADGAQGATGAGGAGPAGAPAPATGPATATAGSLLADPQQQPAQGARPKEPDRRRDAEPGPARPEQVDRLAEAEDSPLKRHGLLDDDKAEPHEEEQPLALEPGAGDEVEPLKDDEEAAPEPAQPELKPEDFLPGTDPDVSAVPTADRLQLPTSGSPPAPQEAPGFPEPPPTKAEQVEEEREDEARDETQDEAEEAAPQPRTPRPEPSAARPDAQGAPRTPDTPEPAADPAPVRTTEAEADGRTARDLQPQGPVEHEAGPEPGPAEPVAATDRQDSGPGRDDERGEGTRRSPAGDRTTASNRGAGPGGPGPQEPGVDADRPGGPPASLDAPGAQPPQPDASLEPGGGGCAGQQQPTTEGEKAEGGGGGCAGGQGGGETKQEEKPAPPDVSGQDPQSALATAGTLPPDQMRSTLDGVDGAVDRSVGERHAALEADAPSAQRPSGAPRTLSGTPQEAAPAEQVRERVEREGAEGGKEQQKAEGEKAKGQNPAADVSRPNVADDAANKVTADDVRNMHNAVGEVPTTDPALNARVEAPKVELSGESDPKRTDKQADNLRETSGRILAVGREDTAKPMGEDQIYPDVPAETLTGNVPGGSGTGGRRRGRTGPAGGGAESGVAIVAQQERGPQVQASVGQAQGRMTTEETSRQQGEAEARERSQEEQDKAVAENAEAQSGERGEGARLVKAERVQWRSEQDQRTEQADTDATAEHTGKNKEIDTKRTDTDKDVGKRQDEDNKQIQDKRQEAEEKAREEKKNKEEESDSWWGWVKSKVKAAFDALLSVITGIFDFFRGIINGIIDKFREFANWAIDQARKFAVELIKKLADALIAIGDVLLAAFPELRDKFRKKIQQWRDKAIAEVNEWADKLKAAVNKLLDLLAAGLNKLLNLLEAGLKAAVNMVRDAVVAAIDFAQKAIAALGQFAALVADIAPDPGGWLQKLGGSAKEGVQNHLWGAVKVAVKQWFNEKVESVLGLGRMVLDVLVKGCVSMAQIGRMAWQALVQSLPMIIISIVVEKVISMIIPAAGAILTIVQGLMAAWGTISKIIAAFGKFFTYLKAVKAGPAACLFAEAVAAGVVALLEFITNFLLTRLKMAAKGVGGRLKAMAQKIMAGLKKATKGPRAAAGAAVNRARDALRRARQSFTTPRRRTPRPTAGPRRTPASRRTPDSRRTGQPRRPAAKRPASAAGRALDSARNAAKNALRRVREATRRLGRKLRNSRVGRALTNSARKVRDAVRRQRDRLKERWNRRKQQRDERRKRENSPQSKERRLALIVARLRPRVQRLLAKGAGHRVHAAVLRALRLWYRLTGLDVRGRAAFADVASLNPEKLVINGAELAPEEVLRFIRDVEQDIRKQAETQNKTAGPTPVDENELPVAEDEPVLASAQRRSARFSKGYQPSVVNYQGAGGGQVTVTLMSPYPRNAAMLWAQKMNTGEIAREERGRYSDSEKRIFGSRQFGEVSRALAAFQRSRAVDFGADPGEVALLGTLAHDIEPRRNPGTAVFSILHSDFYERAGQEPTAGGQAKRFIRAFHKQTMTPEGSAGGATELKKFLNKKPDALDNAIDRRVAKLRAGGVPDELLNGNLRDLPQWQRQVELVRRSEKAVAAAQAAVKKAEAAGDPAGLQDAKNKMAGARRKLGARNTPQYRSLQRLQKQQDALALANREIALIRSWFNSMGAIDLDSRGNADKTRQLLYRRIISRLQTEFTWWVPSKGLM